MANYWPLTTIQPNCYHKRKSYMGIAVSVAAGIRESVGKCLPELPRPLRIVGMQINRKR
jgi:hypothetical protein